MRERMKSQDLDASGDELNTASETHLVALAQRGDEAAFRALFEAHKRRVYSLCLRMTRSAADAEDLTQEAFLLVFRKIANFRGEAAFSTWLYRLAVNQVLMHLRKKRAQPVCLNEVESKQEVPCRREYAKHDPLLTGTVDRITLNAAVAELPRGFRAAFLLHDVEGYQHREIARIMNWSVGSSKSQLNRARRKLRDWFQSNTRNGLPANPNAAEKATR
jgi:RNA polymerase sigma-70 factor, ECF subfamily